MPPRVIVADSPRCHAATRRIQRGIRALNYGRLLKPSPGMKLFITWRQNEEGAFILVQLYTKSKSKVLFLILFSIHAKNETTAWNVPISSTRKRTMLPLGVTIHYQNLEY